MNFEKNQFTIVLWSEKKTVLSISSQFTYNVRTSYLICSANQTIDVLGWDGLIEAQYLQQLLQHANS